MQTKTPAQAKAWFRANGISVTDWCRERGFNRYTVVDLLRGKRRGFRGEAHRVAVALGLKPKPETSTHYHARNGKGA